MIRLRKINGDAVPLGPETSFVELVDLDGNIAMVFCISPDGVLSFEKGSPEASRYRAMFGVNFCPVIPYETEEKPSLIASI